MKIFTIKRSTFGLFWLITAVMSGSLIAAEGQFYIAPGIQWINFNNGTGFDNDAGPSIGLGYGFTERLDVEFNYLDLKPDVVGGGNVEVDQWRVDVVYDLNYKLGQFDTFAVTGLGNNKLANDDDSVWDLGAGVKYQLTDNIVWRTAVRNFYSQDRKKSDFGIDTALVFRFGGRRAPMSAPTPVPVAPVVVDSDLDGVADDRDACPDTPRNYAVDDRGCPIPVEEVARIDLKVNFDFDRSTVKPEFVPEIQRVADFMKQYADVVVELEGYTDSVGTEQYNQGLSERRTNAVRQVLINRFNIQSGRITAEGHGESDPVASNNTAAGRAENRRVITVIIKTLQKYQPR